MLVCPTHILVGNAGDDRLYAGTQISAAAAIANGNILNSGSGTTGDWLNGGTGNDILVGGNANDLLAGGAGDDLLIGGADNDAILGDNDTLPGNFPGQTWHYDALTRQMWLDNVITNEPSDPATSGNDVIYAGEGNDRAFGQYGNDVLFGEGGDDVLQGNSGNDVLLGGAGQDYLYGDLPENNTIPAIPGDDYLDGGAENDFIYGNEGNDILIGGTGTDYLYGGAGADIYIYNAGDGIDHIHDNKLDHNVLRIAGANQANVKLRLGSLMLDLGNGDQIHINNENQSGANGFDQNDVFNSASIGSFEFDDGTVLSTAELLARGFDLDGTAGDDLIAGTNTIDRVNGLGGNDILNGGEGNDTLDGGTGNDLLQGGAGDDVYLFDAGGGQDTITDAQGSNTVRFGAGILPGGITFTRSGLDMVLGIAGSPDQLTLQNWGANSASRISRVEFADGTVWDTAYLQAQISPVITGTAGGDTQTAWFDQNTLMQGQGGDDILLGNNGNDTLQGGAGNDTMDGGDGADTFVLKLGDGQDVIVNSDYMDSLVFGAGITASGVSASASVDGLRLNYGPSTGSGQAGDSVLLAGAYPDELRFADGTALKTNQLFATPSGTLGYEVVGSAASEILADTHYWANSFNGGAGDDTLMGGGGDTTYRFNLGDGKDNLVDLAGQDTLAFGAGIAVNDIRFTYEDWGDYSPKFKIHYGPLTGSGQAPDTISILKGERGTIEKFSFADGTSYSFAQMAALKFFTVPAEPPVTGGSLIQPWNIGNKQLVMGTTGSDTIYATNDANIIISGGKGDDRIQVNENDGSGVASLLFNVGDGHDTINVVKNSSFNSLLRNTSLVFGGGINPNSLSFSYSTRIVQSNSPFASGSYVVTDTTIHYGTNGDSLLVEESLDNSASFEFANGMHYTYSQMRLASSGLGGGVIAGGGEAAGTYQYNSGSGSQLIYGNSVTVGGIPVSSVSFGVGIAPSMLSLGLGSLLIRAGDGGDELHIADFNPNDVYAPNQVQSFSFADGTTLSYSQLIGLGFDLKGSAQDDMITGTNATDRIDGYAGNDTLSGGAGNDILYGGTGSDTYVFGYGDGVDHVYDYDLSANLDTVSFKASVSPGNVEAVRNGNDLELHLAGSADMLVLGNWYAGNAYSIEQMQFADGTIWNKTVVAMMTGTLISDQFLHNQTTLEDGAYRFVIPAGAFSESGLTYTVALADGSALPAWLTFDAATQTFSGAPSNWDVGSLNLAVTATNAGGQSASNTFVLNVLNVNDAPVVAGSLTDQAVIAGQAFSFKLNEMLLTGNSFLSDTTDAGTANQVWPGYNTYLYGSGGNDSYSFARGNGNVFIYDGDNSPLDAVQFTDVSPADAIVMQNQWGDVTLSVAGTADSVTLGSWLYSDAAKIEQVVFADGTVWGVNDIQSRLSTGSTTGNDYITGTGGDDAIHALSGDDAIFSGAGNDTVLAGAGNDWVNGQGGSDILAGGSGADQLDADNSHSNTANDLLSGGAGGDSLYASIANDLLIGGAGDDYVEGDDGNDVVLFNRGDGNDWYGSDYSANGVPLAQRTDTVSLGGGINYADLSFERSWDDLILHVGNGETISFYGWFNTALQDNKAISTLQVVAEAMTGFDYQSADPLLNKRIQQFDFVGLANQFEAALAVDPAITTWQLAPHLANAYLSGSDTAAIGGDMAYLYGKNGNLNGLSEAELRAQLNDAAFGTGNQALTKTPGMGRLFYDVDWLHGDSLTYSAALADGSALPAWLIFDPVTGTFSGTPANGDAGSLNVSVIATDRSGLTATSNFVLTVTGNHINMAPTGTATATLAAGTEDVAYTVSAASLLAGFSDVDGDTLSVANLSASNGSLVDNNDGTYTITPSANFNGAVSLSYNVVDGNGGSIAASQGYSLVAVNDAPAGTVNVNGVATRGETLTAANTLADADGMGVIGYQWQSSSDGVTWANMAGATASTFTLTSAQVGKQVRAHASYIDGQGTVESINSAATAIVNDGCYIVGTAAADVLAGTAGNDVIDGLSGADSMAGGLGNDSYYVDNAGDVVTENAGAYSGIDTVYTTVSYSLTANVEDLVFLGTDSPNVLIGNALNNLLAGKRGNNLLDAGAGNDQIFGGVGNDISQGGSGDDSLSDTVGANLLNGGAGNDTLNGGAGALSGNANELFAGGTGNDTINTNGGADIIAFNRGDGMDAVSGGVGTSNTISLGGGIQYADLALSRSGNDLILETGGGDQLTLVSWYDTAANYKSVLNLQVMAEAMAAFDPNSADPLFNQAVQNFDFNAVVNAFDQAAGANTTFMHWSATSSLLAAHLSASDTEALGGDLAHQYGTLGSFTGMNLGAAQSVLNSAQFGSQAQPLQPLQGLQGGGVTL